jgi:hypothetical protein
MSGGWMKNAYAARAPISDRASTHSNVIKDVVVRFCASLSRTGRVGSTNFITSPKDVLLPRFPCGSQES